ncbi:MAG: quinol:electron acceptor oxidoreductase subunit ActD [Vicinamibacterales bacterium]
MNQSCCLVKFAQPNEARLAIRRLIQAGVQPDSMEVMTSQPIHGEPFIPDMKPTKLRTWALCGAAIGLIGGFSLSTITALNYPLVKGGMPIVAPWTVGLITYETTMLGAVLATLVGLLVELRLPNFKNLPYDPSVVDGGVVLAVSCAEGSRGAVETAIGAVGAPKVNWV